jgi:hypothetical protein
MCSVTGAWVQADVFGLRPRLVFGGGTLHITNEYWRSGGLDNLFEPHGFAAFGSAWNVWAA